MIPIAVWEILNAELDSGVDVTLGEVVRRIETRLLPEHDQE